MLNRFFNKGNQEITEQADRIRLAVIKAVDTHNLTAEIEWLDDKGGKTKVPLPMPMAGPGYGVFAIPTRGTIVSVGLRAMQMPLILGYYPANIFTPLSYFPQQRNELKLSGELSEGDVLIRSRGNVARCSKCNAVSPLGSWAGNLDPNTGIERCPSCRWPSVTIDPGTGAVKEVFKVQYGSSFHMKASGEVEFHLNNTSDPDKGDTDRLFKITIDTDSNVTITNAKNLYFGVDKACTIDCEDFTVQARNAITEVSTTKNRMVATDDVETHITKTIKAEQSLALGGDTLALSGTSLLTQESKIRNATTEQDDIETVGRKVLKSSGEIEVEGAGLVSVKSTGDNLTLDGVKVILQGGQLAIARKTDGTIIDSSTDSAFITFMSNLVSVINTFFTTTYNTHTHTGPGAPPVPTQIAPAPTAPTQAVGKITSGNDTVLA